MFSASYSADGRYYARVVPHPQNGGTVLVTDTLPLPSEKQIDKVTVLSVYKSGGWIMHVLLLCSIATT